jgi:predicted nucleic acid-binding protein
VIVLDASCALELILAREGRAGLARRVVAEDVHAPCLIDVEVVSGLRRLLRQRLLSAERAASGLEWFLDLGIERHHGLELTRRAFALRAGLSAYDAAYVAVAELLRSPLLTADRRLAGSHGHTARIELV